MPKRNLQFDRDAIPRSERENPAASSPFAWEEVFEECDREVAETCEALEPSERQQLAEALSRILRWVYSDGRGTKQRKVDQAIGRRAIALGLLLCPDLMPGGTQSEYAKRLRISRQSISKLRRKARAAFKA
jgi:hypothetical protein